MNFDEIDRLLDPTPMPLEMGYERLANGSLHIAIRTDMHKCTGAMFDWWFRWRCDTQKYQWWHPTDHFSSTWAGVLDEDTVVGSEHVVVERFAGGPPLELLIQFRDPTDMLDAGAYRAAREDGRVSCVITGVGGNSHEPPRTPDGKVLGGRMLHVGRDTEWGLVLRSHFFLGHDLAASGMPPEQVAQTAPDMAGVGLLQHCYNEFTFLSRFLPSLYAGEHADGQLPSMPW